MIVTVTTYCGNLVAFLTFPTIEYPISDLNTLVEKVSILLALIVSNAYLMQGENQEVTWGLLGGSVIENYFEDPEEEKFRLTLQPKMIFIDIYCCCLIGILRSKQ